MASSLCRSRDPASPILAVAEDSARPRSGLEGGSGRLPPTVVRGTPGVPSSPQAAPWVRIYLYPRFYVYTIGVRSSKYEQRPLAAVLRRLTGGLWVHSAANPSVRPTRGAPDLVYHVEGAVRPRESSVAVGYLVLFMWPAAPVVSRRHLDSQRATSCQERLAGGAPARASGGCWVGATCELVTCWACAAFVPGTGGGGSFQA